MKCATVYKGYEWVTSLLESIGTWFPQLVLRLILAWEFGEAGIAKYTGENWFANITFPFPFNLVSPEFSWALSTFFEIFGAAALVIGFATRFFSVSLLVLTIVAIAAVHWPESWSTLSELWQGYAISDKGFGNYKLPLLLLIMLLPLVFNGAGRLSVDHWMSKFCKAKHA
ncbi:MAG: putative oxidoreductase [Methylophilaceae bacterium]|jgi:putative oxidoreductase